MASVQAGLRDAVVSYLNGESYSLSFTAVAANVPTVELEASQGVVVTVFPGDFEQEQETRGALREEWTINIALQKVIVATTPATRLAEEDTMLQLREEIAASLLGEPMSGKGMLALTGEGVAQAPFAAEQLATASQFVAVLGVVYR